MTSTATPTQHYKNGTKIALTRTLHVSMSYGRETIKKGTIVAIARDTEIGSRTLRATSNTGHALEFMVTLTNLDKWTRALTLDERAAQPEATAIDRIDAATQGSYSRDRYEDWRDCIKGLLEAGYTERETIAILASKYTRWAADAATFDTDTGRATADHLHRWLVDPSNRRATSSEAIARLVIDHYAATRG